MVKKHAATDDGAISTSPAKRLKQRSNEEPASPAAIEASLTLPGIKVSDEKLTSTVLITNRAPLLLAFAVTLLKYTMPTQPLSSRLSLAQALVSANSRTKAISIGLENRASAEEEGWGQGQPKVKVMGREISVLKRWGYDASETSHSQGLICAPGQDDGTYEASQETVVGDVEQQPEKVDAEPALWGLDLEALRSSNGRASSAASLPVFVPQSARSYLLRSFASVSHAKNSSAPGKRPTAAAIAMEQESNLSLLLRALDLLFESWSHVLGREEFDRRTWSWYVSVRPEVENGVKGWGRRAELRLEAILRLRREE